MRTILETMTNHLGEFHDIDDVRAGTLHNLKAIDVYNMLREYGKEIVDQCAEDVETTYDSAGNVYADRTTILKVKDLL